MVLKPEFQVEIRGQLWEKLKENQDLQCHIGIGQDKMDVGFVKIEIIATSVNQIENMRKNIDERKLKEIMI